MQTIELNVLSSSINSLFFLLKKGEEIKCFGKGQGGSCFFSPEVRKGVVESCSGCAAGDDPSHIYGHPFCLCLYVFPEGMSIGGHKSLPSLVTRLMVNGSTGNPFKTSRRKARHQIDRRPPRKLFAYQLFSDEKLAHRIYAGPEVVCEMDLLDYARRCISPRLTNFNFPRMYLYLYLFVRYYNPLTLHAHSVYFSSCLFDVATSRHLHLNTTFRSRHILKHLILSLAFLKLSKPNIDLPRFFLICGHSSRIFKF